MHAKRLLAFKSDLRRESVRDRFRFIGNDIRSKTVGIIGIGQIGTRTAELCRGLFAMHVLAHDPYLSAEQISARGATKVALDELLERSDFVLVHCPRNGETMGMIGHDEFALMKPTAFFINTARGGIHKEDDLAEALRAGRIAGAALDVFPQEPPQPDHPLLAFDNVIVSPHNAGMTVEALHDMAAAAAEQWIDIFAGAAPPRQPRGLAALRGTIRADIRLRARLAPGYQANCRGAWRVGA